MVALVERMLELHRRLPAAPHPAGKEMLQREIDSTDQAIDAIGLPVVWVDGGRDQDCRNFIEMVFISTPMRVGLLP